ncbi:MAG: alpha/beta hydrolase [Anaerolineaceae bacterium]
MKIHLEHIAMEVESLGTGKPIVLLHGLGLNHGIWQNIAGLYKEQAQFILPDLRGHGGSELGDANGTIEQYADDILEMMNKLGLEKVVLGGHSMGGYVALAFAEKYPEKLAGLVMIATNAGPDNDARKALRLADVENIRAAGTAEFAEALSLRLSDSSFVQNVSREIIAKTDPEGLCNAILAISSRPGRLHVLAGLRAPLLIAAGAEDLIVPQAAARLMAHSNPNAKFVILPEVGHMPMLGAPRTLGALLIVTG